MKTASQKSLVVIASLAFATFAGFAVAGDENKKTHTHMTTTEETTTREERKNWDRQNENDPTRRNVGDGSMRRDNVFGWADSDEFGNGLGISVKDRRNLFAFWDDQAVSSQLNLTDEQRADLTKCYQETTKKVDAANADAREAVASLRQELDKEEPSVSDVEGYSNELADAMKAKQAAILTHAAVVKRTLNAQQENVLMIRNGVGSQIPATQRSDVRTNPTEVRPNLVGYSQTDSSMITNGGGYEGFDPISQTYTSRYHNTNQK